MPAHLFEEKWNRRIRRDTHNLNSHRAKLFWLPGQEDGAGVYQIRCIDCGAILVGNALNQEFELAGDCDPPETLGIRVSEQVGLEDKLR